MSLTDMQLISGRFVSMFCSSLSEKRDYFIFRRDSLVIKEHHFYIISDQYFRDFPDPNLKGNHAESRPHYFAFKETELDSTFGCSFLYKKL